MGGVPRLLLLEQSGLCSSKKCRWFQVTDCWTNPRATRAAIQEVRNAHAVNCLSAPSEDFHDHDDDFKSENGLDDDPEWHGFPSLLGKLFWAVEEAISGAEADYGGRHDLEWVSTEFLDFEMTAIAQRLKTTKNLNICLEYKGKFHSANAGSEIDQKMHTPTRVHLTWADGKMTAEIVEGGACSHPGDDYFIPDGIRLSDLRLV